MKRNTHPHRLVVVNLLFSLFFLILVVISRVSSSRSCLQVRSEAYDSVKSDSVKTEVVIVPDCDPLNPQKFSPIQCHNSTGYCWCVDPVDGKPIPNTSVRRDNPDCNGRRDNSHLRSRIIRKEPTSSSSCDQNAFSANLLALIKNEFRAISKASSYDVTDRRVLIWKFQQLDTDRDGHLRKRELRSFRKTAKTSVEPRACVKSWLRVLDKNQDNLIVKSEWTEYFTPKSPASLNAGGDEGSDRHLSPLSRPSSGMDPLDFLEAVHSRAQSMSTNPVTNSGHGNHNHNSNSGNNARDGLPSASSSSSVSSSKKGGDPLASLLSESRSKELTGEMGEEEEEEELTLSSGKDCFSARQQAESGLVKNPSSKTYIPVCTESGKYEEVQCYREICWCVDVDKGLPLKVSPGSQGSSKPDCKHAKPVSRPKDCPYGQKLEFLRLLTALFTHEMLSKSTSTSSTSRVKNQVLQWKFNQLDKNRDKFIDLTEWKSFKRSLRGSKDSKSRASAPSNDSKFDSVRHCFRLFFRGCDLNKDKIVTETEWFECTGKNLPLDQHFDQQRVAKNTNSNTGRRGPNPFQTILKTD